jgi:hypothetical protein
MSGLSAFERRRRGSRPGLRQAGSARSAPLRDVNRNALGFRFHDFTKRRRGRPVLWVAMGDLQRSMHDRLYVARVTKLVVVFHVLADDAALIRYVLNPLMNSLRLPVASPSWVEGDRPRRQTRECALSRRCGPPRPTIASCSRHGPRRPGRARSIARNRGRKSWRPFHADT